MQQLSSNDEVILRLYPGRCDTTLVYLPGIHGDWTLITGFRNALCGRFRFVEMTYPRSLTSGLANYADSVERRLGELDCRNVWLLGESFGSQIMWEIASRGRVNIEGLVVAGGFVRYPSSHLISSSRFLLSQLPYKFWERLFPLYSLYAKWRHRASPDALASVSEFLQRRTPEDLQAVLYRMQLIEQNDPSECARKLSIPVHHLYGGIDPVVPSWPVRRWLCKNCRTIRGTRCIPWADHNVLASACEDSAAQVMQWMS